MLLILIGNVMKDFWGYVPASLVIITLLTIAVFAAGVLMGNLGIVALATSFYMGWSMGFVDGSQWKSKLLDTTETLKGILKYDIRTH